MQKKKIKGKKSACKIAHFYFSPRMCVCVKLKSKSKQYLFSDDGLWVILFPPLYLLGRKLGMSNKGWPSWKGCKLISKTQPRHTQESSQICYKNNHREFSGFCICSLGTQWIQTKYGDLSSSGTRALDVQLFPQVSLGSQEPIKGS